MGHATINAPRPPAIINMYWQELIVIEEQAKFLEPVYFWEVPQQEN